MNNQSINFLGSDWTLFKVWLKEEQQDTYKRLVNLKSTEQETNQLRGRAMFIEQLLDLDKKPAEPA